jgi:hypothetical protein
VVVWFEQGVLAVASERKVAGEMFWWPSSFVIRVYHDGEFLLLVFFQSEFTFPLGKK